MVCNRIIRARLVIVPINHLAYQIWQRTAPILSWIGPVWLLAWMSEK